MRLLQIVHGFPPAAHGGTEVYVRDLARALAARGDDVAVLTREGDAHRPEYAVREWTDGGVRVYAINNTFQACRSFADSYENPELLDVALRIVDRVQPEVAHVQHLTCLSTGIPGALHARGIPVVMTLNDYWLICHRGQLLDLDGRRCEGPYGDGCARCLPAGALSSPATYRAGRLARSLPLAGAAHVAAFGLKAIETTTSEASLRAATRTRLDHMRDAVRHVALFLAPSKTVEAQYERFGIPRDRLRRCNQSIERTQTKAP